MWGDGKKGWARKKQNFLKVIVFRCQVSAPRRGDHIPPIVLPQTGPGTPGRPAAPPCVLGPEGLGWLCLGHSGGKYHPKWSLFPATTASVTLGFPSKPPRPVQAPGQPGLMLIRLRRVLCLPAHFTRTHSTGTVPCEVGAFSVCVHNRELRFNAHTVQFSRWKYMIQWFLE